MTLHLSLPPETEARLRERAAAAGKDVETFVRETLEQRLAGEPPARRNGKSHEQWSAELRAWAASHDPTTHFVDDSRESIYADRDE